jgi:hydrogenase maturation protease
MDWTGPMQSPDVARSIVVLGVGNTLCQDDGIGPLVVSELARRHSEHRAAEWIDAGTVGLSLVCHLRGRAGLIVVDAANLGLEPGQLSVLEGAAMDRFVALPGKRSVHEVGLSDLLGAAALSQALPEQRALIAIQPGSTELGSTPTPAVVSALDGACQAVLGLLARWDADRGARSR